MRHKIREQLTLVEPSINHEHAKELSVIRNIISENHQIADLIYEDLIRGLDDPQKGREGAMSAEQVFKVLLIKQLNAFSYDLLNFHLQDSRSYRAFCGFGFADEVPSKTALNRDIKKIRPETLEQINWVVLWMAIEMQIEKGRKVRVDCTVTDSNIHHPTDSSLLFDCVRVLCRLTKKAKEYFEVEVSDHTRRAKKRQMAILNAKNKAVREDHYRDLLKVAKKVVADAQRVLAILTERPNTNLLNLTSICAELSKFIPLAERVIDQADRRILKGEKVKSSEKLVSIFEPHTDIIVKDRRDTYYGHKLALTGSASGLITDLVIEKGNPADTTLATKMIARQEGIYGRVPLQAAFDGGFASKENLSNIKAMGVKDVAFAKKRGLEVSDMAKSDWVYKRLRNFRAGVEGMISYLKRSFGLSRCNWRGFESFKAYAWSSVVTANLLILARHLLV